MTISTNFKHQVAAILALGCLLLLTLAPWVAVSHWLRPLEDNWKHEIKLKDDLLVTRNDAKLKVKAFVNIVEKKNANEKFIDTRSKATIDAMQGFVNSGKFPIQNFKNMQTSDAKEMRFSIVSTYNGFGSVLTELWNTFQFLELNSIVVKANPNKPDEEIVATISVKLP